MSRQILVGAAALILGVLIGAAAYALLVNKNSTSTRHFDFAQIALPGDTAKTPATYRDVTVHYRSDGSVARIELKGCKDGPLRGHLCPALCQRSRRGRTDVLLKDLLKLVYLYAEKESPKYEKATMKFLRRYLEEKEPTLKSFAKVVRELEQR